MCAHLTVRIYAASTAQRLRMLAMTNRAR